ncbi:hypothetical protein SR870_13940 [Rhodopseudomonas palustris]|uniref:hypothetical protein n=1 Tax=Rhodopseudomonas palustris TaxID=1076 RepID=UPI002ACE7479|nr:hypothetical protein [Rhodopseudomonas palustris]WQG97814.1 hypothetical protein SR870_13940 [Rhodopseudomonas palustris]
MFSRCTVATVVAAITMVVGLNAAAHAMGQDPDQNVIRVISATYGASCRVAPGNATRQVAAACNGRRSCNYKVSYKVLGDPAYGCKKDFSVAYSCGRKGQFKRGARGEAGNGTVVPLVCR